MADKQFERLLHQIGHRDRNLKGIAHLMGIPYPTIAEWLNPDMPLKQMKVNVLPAFVEAADDDEVIRYLCAIRGLVAVRLPNPDELDRTTWGHSLAAAAKETGEAIAALAEALADDGRVDHREAPKVVTEIDEALRILVAVRQAAVESME